MSALSELKEYYEDELNHLKHLAAAFSRKYEGAAEHLKIEGSVIGDPHVNRLLEGFAFLAARIHKRLDDDFPELTDALLGIAYPHLLRPVPSLSVVQLELDPDDTQVTAVQSIKRHSEILSATSVDGVQCRFRTCYPVDLAPLSVRESKLSPVAESALPITDKRTDSVLRIDTQVHGAETVEALRVQSLRFFIDAPASEAHVLYELIHGNALSITLRDETKRSVALPLTSLRAVGFGADEGLLDYDARSFLGYRLLHEYFTFPEKYLFFELTGLQSATANFGRHLEIVIELADSGRRDRLPRVTAATFKLGCTPVVNVFQWGARPIALKHRRAEYEVQLDRWQADAIEVYSVDEVNRLSEDGGTLQKVKIPPFYGFKHWCQENAKGQFWYSVRRPSKVEKNGMQSMFIAFVDSAMNPATSDEDTITIAVSCTNGDIPHRLLPFGGGGEIGRRNVGEDNEQSPSRRGDFIFDEPSVVKRIRLLRRPTQTIRPKARDAARWRLISHLALNHMSIVASGRDAFLELLTLYNYSDSSVINKQIQGITALTCSPSLARMTTLGRQSFVRGLDVEIGFDEESFAGAGVYLFASVLERFLALYGSVNSFVRLKARVQQRDKDLAIWPPRAGQIPLV